MCVCVRALSMAQHFVYIVFNELSAGSKIFAQDKGFAEYRIVIEVREMILSLLIMFSFNDDSRGQKTNNTTK